MEKNKFFDGKEIRLERDLDENTKKRKE